MKKTLAVIVIALSVSCGQSPPSLKVGDFVQVLDHLGTSVRTPYKVVAVGDGWVDLGLPFEVLDPPPLRRFPTAVWVSVTRDQISQMTKFEPEMGVRRQIESLDQLEELIRPVQDG